MSFGSRFDSENYADDAALDVTHKWQAKLATIDEKITEIVYYRDVNVYTTLTNELLIAYLIKQVRFPPFNIKILIKPIKGDNTEALDLLKKKCSDLQYDDICNISQLKRLGPSDVSVVFFQQPRFDRNRTVNRVCNHIFIIQSFRSFYEVFYEVFSKFTKFCEVLHLKF